PPPGPGPGGGGPGAPGAPGPAGPGHARSPPGRARPAHRCARSTHRRAGSAKGRGGRAHDAQEEIGPPMAQAKAKAAGPVEKKLIGVAATVIDAADRSKDPTLAIPVRSLANISFNEKRGIIELGKKKQARSFFNVGMAKKFMQTVLVADALAELQRANLTTSLREIYYRTKHT